MKRFTRSTHTRNNIKDTSQLRDQFLRDLTLEATTLMQQITTQFNQTLQAQAAQYYQGIIANGTTPNPIAGDSTLGAISGISQTVATGLRYLVSRPRTSSSASETSRSQGAEAQFRVSQAQAMAEAQGAINKGSKNL